MNKRYRKAVVAANWKMNCGPDEAKKYFTAIRSFLREMRWCKVIFAVPSVTISTAQKLAKGIKADIAAQNCWYEPSGAYTGEVSCEMLQEMGIKYVIVGHSERRRIFGETLETVRKKTEKVLSCGMHPILCVGETEEERKMGMTKDVLLIQLKSALANVGAESLKKIIFAYEPVWAIGTGNTATPLEANQACEAVRDFLREKYGARVARSISILYGGSISEQNARGLFSMPDIDGGLVGGASLDPKKFTEIIKGAEK